MPKCLKLRVAKQVPSDVQTSDPNLNHRFFLNFHIFHSVDLFFEPAKANLSKIIPYCMWPLVARNKTKVWCVCRMSHNLPFRKKSKLSSKERKKQTICNKSMINIMINSCAHSMPVAASAQLHQQILTIDAKVLNLTSFTSHGFAQVVCPHVRSLKYTRPTWATSSDPV